MNKKESAPWPYNNDGQAFIGEGRGAPEAKIKPKRKESTKKEPEKKIPNVSL